MNKQYNTYLTKYWVHYFYDLNNNKTYPVGMDSSHRSKLFSFLLVPLLYQRQSVCIFWRLLIISFRLYHMYFREFLLLNILSISL